MAKYSLKSLKNVVLFNVFAPFLSKSKPMLSNNESMLVKSKAMLVKSKPMLVKSKAMLDNNTPLLAILVAKILTLNSNREILGQDGFKEF